MSFLLLPAVGAWNAFLVVAAVQLSVRRRRGWSRAPRAARAPGRARRRLRASRRPRLAAVVAGVAGAVALAAEVLWTRGLSGVLSSSVYSVALVLAATLCGIAAGTAIAVRAWRAAPRADLARRRRGGRRRRGPGLHPRAARASRGQPGARASTGRHHRTRRAHGGSDPGAARRARAVRGDRAPAALSRAR
jgi:hypothetical protein